MGQAVDYHALLRNDVKKLGNILGEILVHQGGELLLEKVETIRKTTISLRENYDENTYKQLKKEIGSLESPIRQQVIRAFSVYFHLINIAEQNQRIRRRQQYHLGDDGVLQAFSLESAVASLKENHITKDVLQQVLDELSLELVITAHPTEATKRTVLEIQKRISTILQQYDNPLLTKQKRKRLDESLYNDVAALWQTDELRYRKPTVLDEVKYGLHYFEESLFDVLPEIHQELEDQLERYYPNEEWNVPSFLRFGSWIGGDRDGNPFVTAEVTWETLMKQRNLALKNYEQSVTDLMRRFSQSTTRVAISDEVLESVEKDEAAFLTEEEVWPVESEVYRRKFAIILKRLQEVGKSNIGYNHSEQLLHDLMMIKESAEQHQPSHHKLKTIGKVIRQVQLFGFHLATLDIRNHSGEHEAAIAEILQAVNVTKDYKTLSEVEKVQLLTDVLNDPRPLLLLDGDYLADTKEIIDCFRMIKRAHDEFGKRSIEVYIVSMAQSVSDLLEVLVLAKEAGLYRLNVNGEIESDLNVAPLFETIDDLIAAPNVMKQLFEIDVYRKYVMHRNHEQEIMLGYSDGSKDGGTLTANWRLFKAQQEIHDVAKDYNIRLKFFHGRGGSLGRGGGPLYRSILSQPAETLGDGVKITEQGEVLSNRYLLEDIAFRSLEQAASALLEAAAKVSKQTELGHIREKKWEEAMEEISAYSLKKYHSLVFEDRDFLTYFNEATPLRELGSLNIGSRPMSRKNSDSFENLRAIPWVFAWTQSRHLIPAWYAAGTGFESFILKDADNLALLQTMYEKWPFFRSTIDNLQMALVKADLFIAKEYLHLVKDQEIAERIFANIIDEFNRTREQLLLITGNEELLDNTPNIQESVRRRNPYVDPLNFLQVELIQKLRQADERDEELVTEVLLTISGVAAGVLNTG